MPRERRGPLAIQAADDVTVAELVSGWDLSYRTRAADKDITLVTRVGDGETTLRVDERRFQQAVGNIIENAIKFTPRSGTIELRTERRENRLCIVIDDSGPGIPIDERERVFNRFYQLRTGSGRSEGLGLGLAISTKVISAHGGDISAGASPLGGARFTLEFWVT